MKKNELKKLTKDQAMKNIEKLKKDLFNFRFQKINSQITNPSKISETKKTIAQLKTLLKGLKLVSDFLEKNILKPNNLNYPISRSQFINLLK